MDRKTDEEIEVLAREKLRPVPTSIGFTTLPADEIWPLLQTVAQRPDLQLCINHLAYLGGSDEENRRLVEFFDALLKAFTDSYNDPAAAHPAATAELLIFAPVILLGSQAEKRRGWQDFKKWQEKERQKALAAKVRLLRFLEEQGELHDAC